MEDHIDNRNTPLVFHGHGSLQHSTVTLDNVNNESTVDMDVANPCIGNSDISSLISTFLKSEESKRPPTGEEGFGPLEDTHGRTSPLGFWSQSAAMEKGLHSRVAVGLFHNGTEKNTKGINNKSSHRPYTHPKPTDMSTVSQNWNSPKDTQVQRHTSSHTEASLLTCSLCGIVLFEASAMEEHMEIHKNLQSEQGIQCRVSHSGRSPVITSTCSKSLHNDLKSSDGSNAKKESIQSSHQKVDTKGKGVRQMKRESLPLVSGERDDQSRPLGDIVELSPSSHQETSTIPTTSVCEPTSFIMTSGTQESLALRSETEQTQKIHDTQTKQKSLHKIYICHVCGKDYRGPANLKTHLRVHSGERPFQCPCCEKTFKTKGAVKYHMSVHSSERPYDCTSCGKTFSQKDHLRRHQRIHTGERPYECTVCLKRFNQSSVLKTHMRTHKQKQPEQFTRILQLGTPAMQTGNESHTNTNTLCDQESSDRSNTLTEFTQSSHWSVHTKGKEVEQAKLGSVSLPLVTRTRQNQSRPLGVKLSPSPHQKTTTTTSTTSVRQSSSFITSAGTDAQPFNVSVKAEQTSGLPATLTTTKQKSVHKIYICQVCGKECRGPANLKIHLRVHSGERPFQCPCCEKTFKTNGAVKYHMSTHSNERPYDCKTCGKKYTQKDHLRRHQRVHTGERPYECKTCWKSFRQSSVLKTHMQIHSRDVPHPCLTCGMVFAHSSTLRKHLSVAH